MKKSFLIVTMLFAISFSFAQNNMDWQYATRFGGTNKFVTSEIIEPLNYPNHLEIDAEGNAYIFGTYGDNASFYGGYNGLDFNTPAYGDKCAGAFIAKFDCNGNVVWHKAIAREKNSSLNAQYMVLKDNRLYLQGNVHIPVSGFENFVYFLDTTINGWTLNHQSEPQVFPWISNNYYTYIMEFDLDGNMIDYNLFSLYKEAMYSGNGEWIGRITSDLFSPAGDIRHPVPFAIDNQHNLYMWSRMTSYPMYDSLDNTIPQKMVFKLNGEAITDTIMPEDNKYINRILKFDIDFNLQYAKPLVVNLSDTACWGIEMWLYDMANDSDDNIYISGDVILRYAHGVVPALPIDLELADNHHIYFTNTEYLSDDEWGEPTFGSSFIIKMNSDGEILWVDYTKNYGAFGQSSFKSMLLDETSGNIYISALVMPKSWVALDSVIYTNPFVGYSWTEFGENDTVINNYDVDEWKSLSYVIACWDTDGNYKWYNCPLARGCTIGEPAIHNSKLYAGVLWPETGLTCGDSTYMPVMQLPAGTPGVRIGGFGICEWDLQGNMTDVLQIYCKAQDHTIPYDTRINSLGEIYTTGTFDNYMVIGEDSIYDFWDSDMFIAKFGLPCQTYIYDTATYCYGDVVQGVTLTASGDYTFMYPEGDSVVFVHATVLPPLTIGLSDTTVCTAQQFYLDACGDFDSYLWSTGGTGCTEMLQFDNACTQSVSLTVTRGECSASKTISITAQVCDGITEPVTTAMSLYPNPASDIVSIFGDGFLSATVIDISGRTLLRTTAMQLDISGLRPGEYVVKVERLNGETEELKFVKE